MTPSERKSVWERLRVKEGDTVFLTWGAIESCPEVLEDQFLEAAVQIMDRYVDRGVQRGWGGLFSGGGQQ